MYSMQLETRPNASFAFAFRVFLRAINQYAAVLNKKFLDQTNFELQVRAERPKQPLHQLPHSPKDIVLLVKATLDYDFECH